MRLTDKAASLIPLPKRAVVAAISAIALVFAVWGTVCAMSKQVSIVDDKGEKISFKTYASKTDKVLAEQGVVLGEWDSVSVPLDGKVSDGDVIYIHRAKVVTFANGKERNSEITSQPTVREFLKSHGIEPGANIRVNKPLDKAVTANMTIKVTYLEEKTVSSDEVLYRETKKVANSSMLSGETKVREEGSDGVINRVYSECYENGELVSRTLLDENVKVAATDKVVEYGTKARQKIAYTRVGISRGSEYRYKKCITVTATAYCSGTRTATGTAVRYGVVAVDPSVIPLGSRLYIESANGTWIYGTAVAADTGGAIKGNKIDLYVESYSEAVNFGRRTAKVYILE